MRQLKAADTAVNVGIREGRHASGRDIVDIGSWNEFGTARIPPRPFIGGWFDAFEDDNRTLVAKVLQGIAAGKMTAARGLRMLGVTFTGQAQQRIADGIVPPNAPSTIDRKGSSRPLIDTGQLRSSISHWVTHR